MTQRYAAAAPQPTANLFGTPLLAQFLFYLSQHLRRLFQGFGCFKSTLLVFLGGLLARRNLSVGRFPGTQKNELHLFS